MTLPPPPPPPRATARAAPKDATDDSQTEKDVDLCQAALGGQHDLIPGILARGANPNNTVIEKCTPLIHAVIMKRPLVVKALLGYRHVFVDPNAFDHKGNTALHLCVEYGHVER